MNMEKDSILQKKGQTCDLKQEQSSTQYLRIFGPELISYSRFVYFIYENI